MAFIRAVLKVRDIALICFEDISYKLQDFSGENSCSGSKYLKVTGTNG